MFNKNIQELKSVNEKLTSMDESLNSMNDSLKHIATNTNNGEESKYKACCELFIKTFEHERQKTLKIEDKANKGVTFLLAVSSAYIALIIWFINSGYKTTTLLCSNSTSIGTSIIIVLLSIGAVMLLISINKSSAVMWARPEHNPPGDFKHFHHFDKPEKKTIDVYKYYSDFYSTLCEKRRENNFDRGDKIGDAFRFIKVTVFYCLFTCIVVLLFTSNVFHGLQC